MPRISDRRVVVLIFVLALVVRAGALWVRGEYVMPARVGAEAGVVASAVAQGRGFVSPFDGWSASTHLPPLYPVLLAGLIKVQWALGLAPADEPARPGETVFYGALLINLLASAFLPVLALRIAEAAQFPAGVGRLAALMLCFCPEALRAVGLVWDEALFATLCAAWLLLVLRDARREFRWGHPLRAGLAAGVLSLVNPAFVPASVVAWAALNWPGKGQRAGLSGRRFAGAMALLVAALLAAELPWHVRNWFLLEPPARVFVRGNFWLECWTNLNPLKGEATATGTRWVAVHPWQGTDPLVRDGRALCEQEYYAWCRERALAQEEFSEPMKMVRHIVENTVDFLLGYHEALRWHKSVLLFLAAQGIPVLLGALGLVLARARMPRRAGWALGGIIVVFVLPYCVSGAAARYRHPVDLVIYLLAAWGLWMVAGKARGRGAARVEI